MDDKVLIIIASSLTTLLASLTSAYVTHRCNIRRLEKEQQYKMRQERVELLRSRAEELYELTDQWLSELFFNSTSLSSVMQNKITYEDHIELIIQKGVPKINIYRIDLIIQLYIPSLEEAYNRIIASRNQRNEIALRHQKDYENGDINGEKYLKAYVSAQVLIENHIADFKREITKYMQGI